MNTRKAIFVPGVKNSSSVFRGRSLVSCRDCRTWEAGEADSPKGPGEDSWDTVLSLG